ncbi:hypothetical protein K402DRAFT_399026 [Aulographum hederae CBS 113979]|uniref:Uncharacterized protein n=1 Tax=Aulographum hederae CBS 113979 TaxID=1176131 RepID=A0A6G1GJM7_9PEZI|nr:hypothetical protein K402DRAFT_399026 [Aulographum hederae CBS 113979]
MAPFRSSGRNRSGRAQVDHDVFEGLPVRQWRKVDTFVGAPPENQQTDNKSPWPELPMPRDSHLLSEMSQQLLRAARAGNLYKPPTPSNDDEKDGGDDEDEAKEPQTGFFVKKWTQVPRNMEEPEREYLAKRRKGLPSTFSSWSGQLGPLAQSGAMRETKVKRVDAEGNVQVYNVLIPEGQKVEGEIAEEAEAASTVPAVAPGTVVEGVGVANADGVVVAANEVVQTTPARRRPPPPKRKNRKSGPGRKKKVAFAGEDGASTAQAPDSANPAIAAIKSETPGSQAVSVDGDTPMPDAGEDEEEEEGDEEGDDDDDHEDGEVSPSSELDATAIPAKPSETPAPAPAPIDSEEPLSIVPPEQPRMRDPSSSPDLPLATVSHSRQGSLNEATPVQVSSVVPEPTLVAAVSSADDATDKNSVVDETIVVEEPTLVNTEDVAAEELPATAAETAAETALVEPNNDDPVLLDQQAEAASAKKTDEPTEDDTMLLDQVADVSKKDDEPKPDEPKPETEEVKMPEGEIDLFGSLERHLDNESKEAVENESKEAGV